MTKLLTIPKFAQATGLSYRLCLQLVEAGEIPSVPVGSRRRIDIRWVEQRLAAGGYCPTDRADAADRDTEWGHKNYKNLKDRGVSIGGRAKQATSNPTILLVRK